MVNQDQSRDIDKDIEIIVSMEVERLLSKDLIYNEAANIFGHYLRDLSRQLNTSPVTIVDQVIRMRFLSEKTKNKEDQVAEFLNAYKISMVHRRRKGTSLQIADASGGKLKLESESLNEIALIQNRARGKIYEKMGANLVEYYFREIEKYDGPINIIADKTTFESIDSLGKPSLRRFDLFLPDFQAGVEIKSGPISYNKSIRDQIHKDHYLLRKLVVRDIWWFLFYGASQRVLTELLNRKINFLDLGLNDFEQVNWEMTNNKSRTE